MPISNSAALTFIGTLLPQQQHSLILASMLLAIKYNEDRFYDNHYYSSVGGVCLQELNFLEHELLVLLKYDLFVNRALYEKYLQEVRMNSDIQPETDVSVPCEETGKEIAAAESMGSIKTVPSNTEMGEDMA